MKFLRFSPTYFVLFLVLLLVEILIALYVRDSFIRPYGGDVLVVILIYAFSRSFVKWHWLPMAVAMLLVAFAVELSQYFHLIRLLNLQDKTWAHWVLGSSYHWLDLVAYFAGFALIVVGELIHKRAKIA